MSRGTRLWNQAKQIIPGGNQLLSKRAEMFLPEQWPAYFQKAKGCVVWDLDGKRYYDLSIMGIGACVLGYAHSAVNRVVKKAIDQGSASSLNSYEEVELAQELIKIHPWASMVRFARTGGEACAVAVRIARAYTGKDKVAFCGYHGWHDWYLAANLANNKSLDGHLLPGLEPLGVPRKLRGTSIPFLYGDLKSFRKIVKENKNELGVVVMEVERHKAVDLKFLKEIRKITQKIGAVLIYDEISSGFRVNIGGLHLKYKLEPDMTVLGKALGNGFPIAAILGKKRVMQAAQKTFISSTNWTERVGFAAALETLKQFKKLPVINHITKTGNYITKKLTQIFKDTSLKIEIVGLPSVVILSIKEENPLLVKTIFTQEMLQRGFLASTVIYVSLAHTKKIVDLYLKNAREVFTLISQAKKDNKLKKLLKGPVCHAGFKRLI